MSRIKTSVKIFSVNRDVPVSPEHACYNDARIKKKEVTPCRPEDIPIQVTAVLTGAFEVHPQDLREAAQAASEAEEEALLPIPVPHIPGAFPPPGPIPLLPGPGGTSRQVLCPFRLFIPFPGCTEGLMTMSTSPTAGQPQTVPTMKRATMTRKETATTMSSSKTKRPF